MCFTAEGTDAVGVQAETEVPEGIILILGPSPPLIHDLAPTPTLVHQGDHIVFLSILFPDIIGPICCPED